MELKRHTLEGTILSSLHVKYVSKLRVIVPPNTEEQRRISDILFTILKKIKINLQINNVLERIAFSIFKLWFAYFEPFQDLEFIEIDYEDFFLHSRILMDYLARISMFFFDKEIEWVSAI